jgi:hypothetical protein
MRPPVLAVALLLVVAGCGGTGQGGGADPTPTLSPAPTVDDDPPPGLSATGVVNATALAAAHGTALADRSFARTSRFRVVDDEGVIYRENTTQRVADGRVARTRAAEWSARAPVRSVATRLDLYHADGKTFTRATDNGVSYRRVRAPDGLDDVRGVARLRELYVAGRHWTVTETRVAGERGYRLVATDVALTALRSPSFVRSPRDVRLRVTVTAAGRLVGWRLAYVVDFAGGPAQATRVVQLSGVGETAVAEPAWLDAARNTTA